MSSAEVKEQLFRAFAIAVLAIGGCVSTQQTAATPKLSSKPLYQAPPDRVQTSMLLDFDNALDTTFVDSAAVRLADDPSKPGNRVLAADGETRLNLTSLVLGRDVGGVWDIVGVRVWSGAGGACEIGLLRTHSISEAPTHVTLPAHTWTRVWLPVPGRATQPGTQSTQATNEACLKLTIVAKPGSRLLIDEVSLAQSRVTVSESRVPKTNEPWRVMRDRTKWIASIDGKSIFELPAAPFVADGYRLLESDPTRALFINDAGSTLCIDRTGRLIENGKAKLDPTVLKVAKAIAENASPAKIEIVGDEGRIERSLPGDADNDGYDERRGCYTAHAAAGRATLRLTRQGATVKWPAIEIYDLPPGAVSVWLDGEIIPWAVRADDGRVIVELPGELDRPLEVQIRAK